MEELRLEVVQIQIMIHAVHGATLDTEQGITLSTATRNVQSTTFAQLLEDVIRHRLTNVTGRMVENNAGKLKII